jgi:hypothetical protein
MLRAQGLAMSVQTDAPRIRSKLAFYTLFATAIAFSAKGNIAYQKRIDVELNALPSAERKALYVRTTDTLRSTCSLPVGSLISDYCREQAQFLSRFSECNDTCQQTCRQFFPKPTK